MGKIGCPHCGGKGEIRALVDGFRGHERFADWRTLKCGTCHGRGALTPEEHQRVEAGVALREERVARGLTLRQEARRLGIDPIELSMREWGRQAPEAG